MYPGISSQIVSYIIGLDSLKATSIGNSTTMQMASEDIRLHMDGIFEQKEHAVQFTKEFIALYTNGPAGGGGIRSLLLTVFPFSFLLMFCPLFSSLNHIISFFLSSFPPFICFNRLSQ